MNLENFFHSISFMTTAPGGHYGILSPSFSGKDKTQAQDLLPTYKKVDVVGAERGQLGKSKIATQQWNMGRREQYVESI